MRKLAIGFLAGATVVGAAWVFASTTNPEMPRPSHLATAGIGCENFGDARAVVLTDGRGSVIYSLDDEKRRAECTKDLSAMWRRHGQPGCWSGPSSGFSKEVAITWRDGRSSCYGDRFTSSMRNWKSAFVSENEA